MKKNLPGLEANSEEVKRIVAAIKAGAFEEQDEVGGMEKVEKRGACHDANPFFLLCLPSTIVDKSPLLFSPALFHPFLTVNRRG